MKQLISLTDIVHDSSIVLGVQRVYALKDKLIVTFDEISRFQYLENPNKIKSSITVEVEKELPVEIYFAYDVPYGIFEQTVTAPVLFSIEKLEETNQEDEQIENTFDSKKYKAEDEKAENDSQNSYHLQLAKQNENYSRLYSPSYDKCKETAKLTVGGVCVLTAAATISRLLL